MIDRDFTPEQITDWKVYERVRKGGKYNMFELRARQATGLGSEEFSFVMHNYNGLKEAAKKAKP